MEKTIKFEMTESQAEKFENFLDATLEVLTRLEKESPERQARAEKHHEEFCREIAETKKMMEETSNRMAKWEAEMEV